jgi:hypothetical protein
MPNIRIEGNCPAAAALAVNAIGAVSAADLETGSLKKLPKAGNES